MKSRLRDESPFPVQRTGARFRHPMTTGYPQPTREPMSPQAPTLVSYLRMTGHIYLDNLRERLSDFSLETESYPLLRPEMGEYYYRK